MITIHALFAGISLSRKSHGGHGSFCSLVPAPFPGLGGAGRGQRRAVPAAARGKPEVSAVWTGHGNHVTASARAALQGGAGPARRGAPRPGPGTPIPEGVACLRFRQTWQWAARPLVLGTASHTGVEDAALLEQVPAAPGGVSRDRRPPGAEPAQGGAGEPGGTYKRAAAFPAGHGGRDSSPPRTALPGGVSVMKFRAKIVDAACLNHFTRVSCMVAKLARACTLRIRPHKLNFILPDTAAGGGVSMWCELPQENFFSEFQMEGVSQENNEIYVELTTENLSRALRTAQNARALKVKLTNRHFPCLTVSIELVSVSSSSRMVTHDIPIKVIPRKLWKNLQEPTVPDCDVSIYLPVLKTMKSVVEKMKNISNHLIIEANLNGDLNLKIESELVCVTTHFKDLGNPPSASEGVSQDRSPAEMAEVHIDIRKFLQFLAGQQVNPTKGVCNVVSHKMVHFDLLHEDVSLQYFIPALS
ncbi:checkpoint protein HUS1 isoform 2-T2 [Molossus nigricans]